MKYPELVFRITVILAFLISIVFISCHRPSENVINIGEKAPEFTLSDLEGKKVSLIDFKGKVVLIDFWATWCPPCRESIPFLNSLHQEYNVRGFVVMAINVDERGPTERIKSAVDEFGIKYKVLISDDLTPRLYDVAAIPVGFLVNKEQKIVNRYFGYNPYMKEALLKDIKELL